MHTTYCTQHCCDMLHGIICCSHLAWACCDAGQLFCDVSAVLKCCDHLAWSIHIFTLNGCLAVSHIRLILLINVKVIMNLFSSV